ncbi:FAD/NAD(P)-binding domain-containing protein [Saccharata proteae CBS 121410]|uniref:FAD/NAD(P)-binding domain-containing protein n=1 Tax=Saccharata proteae CBS 121410 TaxID=1314787 RepID=A0A9P4LVP5_9PEZI|nr:FAD/NAD(P)-binding domain-containing protein [Saccharata proteae CBS 121410]
MSTSTPLSIAIIGAGPVGTLLARLLTLSPVPLSVTIFELDPTPTSRSQGGTLDLHTTTGLAALKAASLYDEFLSYARFDGEAMRLCDKNLKIYISVSQNSSREKSRGAPEIDRMQLRSMLIESLPEGVVRWGWRLLSVSPGNDNKGYTLHFDHNRSESGFDLVVGADGAWSRVRPVLTDKTPYYAGVCGHTFSIPDAETREPELYGLVNRGTIFPLSDGKCLAAQQMGDGSLWVSSMRAMPESYMTEILKTKNGGVDGESVLKELYEDVFKEWDPRIKKFITAADPKSVRPLAINSLPEDSRWTHRRGVTLVGDAAHLMVPFAGEGVNIGMADSMNLAKAIIAAAQSPSPEHALDTNVRKCEEEMWKSAQVHSSTANKMMGEFMFTPGAPRTSVHRWICHKVWSDAPLWYPLVAPLVYAYFFVFRLLW